jgi:hypothetical protein
MHDQSAFTEDTPSGLGPAPQLSWRWRRANWLLETRKRTSRRECKKVRRAQGYLHGKQAGKRLSLTGRAITRAVVLHKTSDARCRWLLEAFLLTNINYEDLARRIGERPAVISWYHDLFFCVRDHGEARDWLMTVILDERKRHAIQPDDEEFYLKLYAFHGGVAALEQVRAYFASPAPPSDSSERLSWLRVRAAILARCLPASTETAGLIFELQRLAEANRPRVEDDRPLLVPLRPAISISELVEQVVRRHCPRLAAP